MAYAYHPNKSSPVQPDRGFYLSTDIRQYVTRSTARFASGVLTIDTHTTAVSYFSHTTLTTQN